MHGAWLRGGDGGAFLNNGLAVFSVKENYFLVIFEHWCPGITAPNKTIYRGARCQ
jgi:hypothetical protein